MLKATRHKDLFIKLHTPEFFGLAVDPNVKAPKGSATGEMTTLHMLAARGDTDMLRVFLNAEHKWRKDTLKLDLRDWKGRTPLDVANELGHSQAAKMLKEYGATSRFDHLDL